MNNQTDKNTGKIIGDRIKPNYYNWLIKEIGIEPLAICRLLNFNLGNVIKYVLRAGRKTEQGLTNNEKQIEDLKKAVFYLEDEIKRLKG